MKNKIRNLFTADEWEWFVKIGASYSDPEQKKVFFEAIKEKKMENPEYSLFTDFPRGLEETAVPSPTPHSSAANNAPRQNSANQKFKGAEICREIIAKLSPGGKSA